ncbi:AraC-like DNA-binding protein [Rhizobium sp. BK316]|uniref:AraC family transcriptional regulator n=1 Tax=Rhizobium sp. BK316 TaxID=2587053 RepID=UPI00161A119A|nr:helix-turn-helix transcriptional regulator [Rhizobium sp. BK316]MBB3409946.1 AraC-like DNA-binding protein [Rhizobium sp. BK316]
MNIQDRFDPSVIDEVSRPAFSFITETSFVGESEPHRHGKAQLLYVMSGVLTMRAAGGVWTVPPNCALWIPGGVPHSGRMAGHIKIGNLYIDAKLTGGLKDECGILFVQPFLRELIFRLEPRHDSPDMAPERLHRLVGVLLDELSAAPLEPIHLPMPTDRRLQRLTEAMVAEPGLRFTIDEWGARVGASNRTLSRLFQRETGMSFVRWRQQLHIGVALQRLAAGQLVTVIAGDLGYESVSAFIAMFRRMLGTTPTRYFSDQILASSHRLEITADWREEPGDDGPDHSKCPASNLVPFRREPN